MELVKISQKKNYYGDYRYLLKRFFLSSSSQVGKTQQSDQTLSWLLGRKPKPEALNPESQALKPASFKTLNPKPYSSRKNV